MCVSVPINKAINNNGARIPAQPRPINTAPRVSQTRAVLSVLISATLCAMLANSDNRQPITPGLINIPPFRWCVAPPPAQNFARAREYLGVSSGNPRIRSASSQRELGRCAIGRRVFERRVDLGISSIGRAATSMGESAIRVMSSACNETLLVHGYERERERAHKVPLRSTRARDKARSGQTCAFRCGDSRRARDTKRAGTFARTHAEFINALRELAPTPIGKVRISRAENKKPPNAGVAAAGAHGEMRAQQLRVFTFSDRTPARPDCQIHCFMGYAISTKL